LLFTCTKLGKYGLGSFNEIDSSIRKRIENSGKSFFSSSQILHPNGDTLRDGAPGAASVGGGRRLRRPPPRPPVPPDSSEEYEEIGNHDLEPISMAPLVATTTADTDANAANNGEDEGGPLCDLCGVATAMVRCALCSGQLFCLACDEMYHRHPKRAGHDRKVSLFYNVHCNFRIELGKNCFR